MYKLIIVDDENFTRKMLANTLDWASLGFEIVGSFSDGRYALDFLKENKVDVIIADIKMTFVSGLELAKEVNILYTDTIVVLLSGYKEFDFAREALQYNVSDYLLKPITYAELHSTFKKLSETLTQRAAPAVFLDDEISLQRQYVLSNFLSGSLNSSETIKDALKDAKIIIDPYIHPVAIINVHMKDFTEYVFYSWKHGKERLYNALNQFMQKEDEKAYFIPYQYAYDNIRIISLYKADQANFRKHLNNYFTNLSTEVLNTFGLTFELSILQIADNLMYLSRFKPSDAMAAQQSRMLLSYLHAGNLQEALSSTQTILSTFENNMDMLNMLIEHLIRGLAAIIGIKEVNNLNLSVKRFNNKDDTQNARQYILNIINRSYEYITANQRSVHCHIIDEAINYINEHFFEDITREDVANHVAVSPAYFSKYFKSQTNEKFIDFLSRMRIEKAQELIKSNRYKIYEIRNMVGYKKDEHFNKLFKLYTGFTPSEYRNNLMIGGMKNDKE